MEQWTFMTNHGHVLLCIAADPAVRLRDVASRVGITERAAQRIVADLCDEGYLTRLRTGRRNRYEMHPELPFRHRCRAEAGVGALIDLAGEPPSPSGSSSGVKHLIPLARPGALRAHPA
ncbi:MAG: helix-turn-helix transcriptional regulator [Tepidiformaceae bacterium]